MQSKAGSKIRIAFLPAVVGGHPIVLSQSIEKLGFDARTWQLETHPFGYGNQPAIFRASDGLFLRELKRLRVLFQVLAWSDVIHCTFGSTLAGNTSYSINTKRRTTPSLKHFLVRVARIYEDLFLIFELGLYRITKKRLVIDFQGDDIRQKDFQIRNYKHSIAHAVGADYYSSASDSRKRRRIKIYERFGFQMNALNPDLLHYLPKGAKFVPYSIIRVNPERPKKILPTNNVFIFVHAPSSRTVKGTGIIIEVMEQLRSEGVPVELKLVEGITHSEALLQYDQAFMAIDQLNAGWYGGFAVECMAKGVPTMSYLRTQDLEFLPREMRRELPVRGVCSCNLKERILQSIRISQEEYELLSQNSINFVHKWHNPDVIAAEVVKAYI